jgi:peptidoglycan/xylan/chitin deacetylase (PgdA/CDA1 family)
MLIYRTPSFLPWIFSNLLWRVETKAKEIYLTFDDGPIPGPTEFVLDTLKQFNAKATFFCIGENISKHPEIFQQVIIEGHAVGNHTFNHMKGWGTSTEKYVSNVEMCANEMSKKLPSLGYQIHQQPGTNFLFRPPYGRIRPKQINALKGKYQIVMWDVLTSDYNISQSPEACLKGSIKATRPGSIVVFHDSLKAERNMKYALPRYLEYFVRQGYIFKELADSR